MDGETKSALALCTSLYGVIRKPKTNPCETQSVEILELVLWLFEMLQ